MVRVAMVVNRDGGFIREVVAGTVLLCVAMAEDVTGRMEGVAVDEISGVDVRMNEDENDEVVVVDVN